MLLCHSVRPALRGGARRKAKDLEGWTLGSLAANKPKKTETKETQLLFLLCARFLLVQLLPHTAPPKVGDLSVLSAMGPWALPVPGRAWQLDTGFSSGFGTQGLSWTWPRLEQ